MPFQNLDTSKSSGLDSIYGHFLSHLGILGRERLLYICIFSWKTGKLPRHWKSAIVNPIDKPNKNTGITTRYHLISFTPIPYKKIKIIVLRRLTPHSQAAPAGLMPPEHFAFHKGHSKIDQILYFIQCVRNSQNDQPPRYTLVAFLDVSKAFDRVWKYKLLSKCFSVLSIEVKLCPGSQTF
ncbi:RNA-directed DNA polymerase from mobile element jockey [Trichonephila clavipes]|nr:RNA-directed DNA polymerase from mobile element jockey [Trichonephila clavipes]